LEKHTVSIFRTEVAKLGSGGIYIGKEKRKAEGVSQSETRNEGEKVPGQQQVSKQASKGEGLGRVGREEIGPFQGPLDEVVFLVRACFLSLRS
jgi:hypothetical protein